VLTRIAQAKSTRTATGVLVRTNHCNEQPLGKPQGQDVLVPKQRGFTLIELLITITILGILFAAAIPNYRAWIQNTQIRSAAESLQAGLNLARSEAVRRNTRVEFVLTNSTPDESNVGTVTASTAGVNWLVRQFESTTYAASDFIQSKTGAEGASQVTVGADASSIAFSGLGRASAPLTINLTNPSAGTCAALGGNARCLRINVSIGGQVRMCDPSVTGTDTRACPANATSGV
jgi:type IV fimbrial biogenesis protein FimT